MNLTNNDFKNRISIGTITHNFHINGYEIYKLGNNSYFRRLDSHSLGFGSFNEQVGIYNVNGNNVLRFYERGSYTFVQKIDVLENKMIEAFTGFEAGKSFELQNGQIWKQVGDPHAPGHESSGYVKIYNNRMKVDDWDFYPEVIRIK
ncbi:hypothetical protein [Pedobacter psychrodurus]|uniref:hypothetical protein n=1 Tax=Pedobacter psychrodurus TaxID=2530456 RepID=UPI00292F8B64|nr:hypothetical protein [Pedobacter psychrodurus]